MKKHIITAAALLVTAIAVFGTRAVKSHFDTVRNGVKAAVRSATPTEYEVERIKSLIDDMSNDVVAYGEKISETESQVAAQRTEAAGLEKGVAADRLDLKTERYLLAREGDRFEVRGTTYTRLQIEASAQARMQKIGRDEARLATLREAIMRLEGDVRDGHARLRDAAGIRDKKLQELDVLKTKLANAELAGELDELAKPLRHGEVSKTQSELAMSLRQFEERVKREERKVARGLTPVASPALIQHQDNPLRPSLMDEIERVLGPATNAVSAVEHARE